MDDGISMVEQKEELNIKYYFSGKDTGIRMHLSLWRLWWRWGCCGADMWLYDFLEVSVTIAYGIDKKMF